MPPLHLTSNIKSRNLSLHKALQRITQSRIERKTWNDFFLFSSLRSSSLSKVTASYQYALPSSPSPSVLSSFFHHYIHVDSFKPQPPAPKLMIWELSWHSWFSVKCKSGGRRSWQTQDEKRSFRTDKYMSQQLESSPLLEASGPALPPQAPFNYRNPKEPCI